MACKPPVRLGHPVDRRGNRVQRAPHERAEPATTDRKLG